MNVIWLTVGGVALVGAVIGALLPVVPTVPFLLLAAFAFSKGSPRLHAWLLSLPTWGPQIRNWEEHRMIQRRTKWFSTAMILVGAIYPIFFAPFALALRIVIVSCLLGALLFIWTRAEHPKGAVQRK